MLKLRTNGAILQNKKYFMNLDKICLIFLKKFLYKIPKFLIKCTKPAGQTATKSNN